MAMVMMIMIDLMMFDPVIAAFESVLCCTEYR